MADDPFSIQARLNYANVLMAAGQLEDAKAQLLRAVELSPEWQAPVDVELTRILLVQKRYAEALEHLVEWPPGLDQDTGLAIVHRAIGNGAEADAAIARLAAGTGPGSAVRLSEVYAQSGDPDEAFRWMARAYERLGHNAWLSPQWHWLYPLRFSPLLTPLHEDPRWAHIRMRGMPPGAEAVLAVLPKQFEPEVKNGTGRMATTP